MVPYTLRRDLLLHLKSASITLGLALVSRSGADRQGTGMLRHGLEDTIPTNAVALRLLIRDYQMRDSRSADPGSLGKEFHQHGGVQR